ncbi:MAG: arsenite S-adenosylmethyltransferase [candidate division Zixibacteria bacterium RBG_16_50_21]|nr:MAG: arsenite S-adenosylmethyltransferase [candidate division Zixibacteria bacterium RBG_16_50_21]
MNQEKVKQAIRKNYAKIAIQRSSCCAPPNSCCGGSTTAADISKNLGYSEEELTLAPPEANLGLGCGNPVALASLQEGENVLDLGSGAGLDCFLAAAKVGDGGRVIGVDMTPEMVTKARENARQGNYANVEFRLGEIENLPVASNSMDAVISNCVLNLVPDKNRAFRETFRVLKPGARLMISDIVLLEELPESIKGSIEAYVGCLSGAILKHDYLKAILAAGFREVEIVEEAPFSLELTINDPTAQSIIENSGISTAEAKKLAKQVSSVKVRAVKPA